MSRLRCRYGFSPSAVHEPCICFDALRAHLLSLSELPASRSSARGDTATFHRAHYISSRAQSINRCALTASPGLPEPRRHLWRIACVALRARHAWCSALTRARRSADVGRLIVVSLADPQRAVTACALQSHRGRFGAASQLGPPDLASRQPPSPAETTDMHAWAPRHTGLQSLAYNDSLTAKFLFGVRFKRLTG